MHLCISRGRRSRCTRWRSAAIAWHSALSSQGSTMGSTTGETLESGAVERPRTVQRGGSRSREAGQRTRVVSCTEIQYSSTVRHSRGLSKKFREQSVARWRLAGPGSRVGSKMRTRALDLCPRRVSRVRWHRAHPAAPAQHPRGIYPNPLITHSGGVGQNS